MATTTLGPASALPLEAWRGARDLALLLDYDGTLVPFAPRPELAAPDPALLELLGALAGREGAELHLVSGRDRPTLEAWFGHLPIALHGEHGYWTRPSPGAPWRALPGVPTDWKPRLRALLEGYARPLEGAFVEEKSASLGWHYRAAARAEAARAAAAELAARLRAELEGGPLELLEGDCVLEVRARGVNKGRVVAALVEGWGGAPKTVIAFGDDRTDEDMFAALPPGAFAVHVGDGPSAAALRVPSPRHVREALSALAPPPARP
ncbi:MAG TPA: trehalose-phosphatase [Polyangiaceae bacterium]|nr:trehalose-phosphatase [Polyangiaceae bacterium]